MSRSTPRAGPPPDAASDVRPLPPRPSLEFERKQARRLLRQLQAGDAEAMARVRAKLERAQSRTPDGFKLADAQFTIAREYGFTSWPRLVEYFETLGRHEASGADRQSAGPETHERWAQGILARHRNRRNEAAQMLAAFVPRFYGRTTEEVLAAEATIDDARLVQARMHRYPSWEVLLAADRPPRDVGGTEHWAQLNSPLLKAIRAIRAEDADRLSAILAQHPELLTETEPGQPGNIALVRNVLVHDLRTDPPAALRLLPWLSERIDVRSTLNWMLLGHWRMRTDAVRGLLDAGADPAWVAPNGFSVVEHAIVRYWNQEAVDLIASRVLPPRSFWVAAGLGDVAAVERFVDRHGRPTAAARKHRPDFTALHVGFLPLNPAADDQTVVWEAFIVAALNQRFAVLDILLDRGFPIDYGAWGQSILHLAVGNGWVPLVEYLVRRGANVEPVREMAEQMFVNPQASPDRLRILELCRGRDPVALILEHEAQRSKRVMQTHPMVEEAFVLAKQDAIREGRGAVSPENLLIAILRQAGLPLSILAAAGVDLDLLSARLADRITAEADSPPADMTSDPDATAVLLAAREEAERRKHDTLITHHVFLALAAKAEPMMLAMLGPAGATRARLHAEVERFLGNW